MARLPSGKLRQCTEWCDFAGERTSGVRQPAPFQALPLAIAVTWTWRGNDVGWWKGGGFGCPRSLGSVLGLTELVEKEKKIKPTPHIQRTMGNAAARQLAQLAAARADCACLPAHLHLPPVARTASFTSSTRRVWVQRSTLQFHLICFLTSRLTSDSDYIEF